MYGILQMIMIFQSTLPGRGATLEDTWFSRPAYALSIHAPRAGSDTPCVRL